MNQNGLKGTFNISSSLIRDRDATKARSHLSAKQIKELYLPNGHEIAIHTFTHPTLTDLPIENVTDEYIKDKEILEGITGGIIRGSAYPNSRYNNTVLSALKACGVSYARGGDETEGLICPPIGCRSKTPQGIATPSCLSLQSFFWKQK